MSDILYEQAGDETQVLKRNKHVGGQLLTHTGGMAIASFHELWKSKSPFKSLLSFIA